MRVLAHNLSLRLLYPQSRLLVTGIGNICVEGCGKKMVRGRIRRNPDESQSHMASAVGKTRRFAKSAKGWGTRPRNQAILKVKTMSNGTLSKKHCEEILTALKVRFEKNMNRHQGLEWAKVQAKLEAKAEKLWSLNEMERTGGEPDVVGHDKKTGEYIFYDCSPESLKAAEVF